MNTTTNVLDLMRNPLVQEGQTSSFIRLILAECGAYGMPAQIIATLDDVAAMLGYYEPLPANQAARLAAPLVNWRSDRRQPTYERVSEIEMLALKQRALIAFGGGPDDHMVGTAEIVVAMGNLHKGFMPEGWYEVFCWASTDVLQQVTGETADAIRKDKKWPAIPDADVVGSGGRFNAIYTIIVTEIRRTAIAALKDDPEAPRAYLRPVGAHFLRSHIKVRDQAERDGKSDVVARLQRSIDIIQTMFPELLVTEKT
jgi:hypothetical protein